MTSIADEWNRFRERFCGDGKEEPEPYFTFVMGMGAGVEILSTLGELPEEEGLKLLKQFQEDLERVTESKLAMELTGMNNYELKAATDPFERWFETVKCEDSVGKKPTLKVGWDAAMKYLKDREDFLREAQASLSVRAWHCLSGCNLVRIDSKEQFIEAIRNGKFSQKRVYGLGRGTLMEICGWLGIEQPPVNRGKPGRWPKSGISTTQKDDKLAI